MRGGTSRGPFFLREWLPDDDVARDEALIGAIGASDLLPVDGVGGGSTLTSKVAIVSPSSRPDCDVDYLFAQVGVGQRSVDTRPNCGNMLAGVGPFAIEQGLVPATDGTTTVRVFNVNTSSRIDAVVQTPGGRVTYVGDTRIDGVAGTGAPIRLNFLDAWGAVTGAVFPTGRRIDVIDGVEVTCIDAAMPLMIVRAADLGVDGHETPEELDVHPTLRPRLESLRLQGGRRRWASATCPAASCRNPCWSATATPPVRDLPVLHAAPVPHLPRGDRSHRRGDRVRPTRHRGRSAREVAAGRLRGRGAAPAGPDRGRGRGRRAGRRDRGAAARRSSERLGRSCRAIFTCPTTCSRRLGRAPA